MIACDKDCFANINGRCLALDYGYEDKPCPFQKNISRLKKLYEENSEFHRYVYEYSKSKRMFVSYALIEKPVIEFAKQIMFDKRANE